MLGSRVAREVATSLATRLPSIPGSGGYGGGLGYFGSTSAYVGNGPGGGSWADVGCPGSEGHGPTPHSGSFTGNAFLVPLVGGSGGAGNVSTGGAGGGALLLASSTSINLNGVVTARGGRGIAAPGGS